MRYIIGIDEVGRGSLAGPVVVAAVLLEPGWKPGGRLKDSKKLTTLRREEWLRRIKKSGISYAVSRVSPAVIDRINISRAANRCAGRSFNRLVAKLGIKDKKDVRVYLDGGLYIGSKKDQVSGGWDARTVVKGDEKINAVKLASIIAKVTRDRYMTRLDGVDPRYGFGAHKGYGTRAHRSLVRKYGPGASHRLTFLSKTINI
jgi:ribonuclease HII